jgi:hypothetical protein
MIKTEAVISLSSLSKNQLEQLRVFLNKTNIGCYTEIRGA